jgi:hypothetical protein
LVVVLLRGLLLRLWVLLLLLLRLMVSIHWLHHRSRRLMVLIGRHCHRRAHGLSAISTVIRLCLSRGMVMGRRLMRLNLRKWNLVLLLRRLLLRHMSYRWV